MSTLLDLKKELGAASARAEKAVLSGNLKAAEQAETEVDALVGKIKMLERIRDKAMNEARPAGGSGSAGGGRDGDGEGRFRSLGEQLIAIQRHYSGGFTDARLKAPFGMGEADPSGGGFAIQTDFATSIMTRMYDQGEIASRVFKMSISSNANGIKIPGIDETSRATGSRWGGVQAYWVAEGDTITASKPKFRLIELDLKKIAALWYVTDEMLQDASALEAIANEAFAQELTFLLEDAIFRGTGAGMPQGFLKSNALITVPKDSGQAAKTLTYNNLLTMWSRMYARSRSEAVWFINQDVEPQLYAVNQVIGTAGVPVYLPPGGISEKPYATLFGRPVIPVEQCDTLGAPGDIVLADLSQYVLADKAAMQQAMSMHVRFVTDETAFRLTYRVDGQSIWHAPLTPYKGTSTRSPFVVLAAR